QEELRARINKTESIDELKDRWYKTRESKPQEPRPQEIKTLGVNEGVRDRTKQEPPVCNTK
ncbi:MAG: hypothetical protein COV63_03185, partial [Candidatus Nealsonbacteria bacterium CG11_big_fil_rev_8_21_14_0_20_37_68]